MRKTLSPIQERMPHVLLYHYIDDIIISAKTVKEAVQTVSQTVTSVSLTIASEKNSKSHLPRNI